MTRRFLFLLRWSVFAIACAYVWREWNRYESSGPLDWRSAQDGFPVWWWLGLLATGGLMLLNWGIEAQKWKVLIGQVERLSWMRAFEATLAGCSVSVVTPNRTGEFVGRVLFLAPEGRIEAAALTVLGNLSQLLVTLMGGALGAVLFRSMDASITPAMDRWFWLFVSAAVVSAYLVGMLFFRPERLRSVLAKLPFLRRFEAHFGVLTDRPVALLHQVMLLSTLRYAVFVGQFVLLLCAFGANVPVVKTVISVPLVFLLNTLVPSMMLTELGTRAASSMLVLQGVGAGAVSIALASSVLWAINVLVPAVIGSVILLMARIRTKDATP